jgi:hypothetical protein
MTLWDSRTKRGLERLKTPCRGIGFTSVLNVILSRQHRNTFIDDGLEAMQRYCACCLPLFHPGSCPGA